MANIGSKPETRFRGQDGIFGHLIEEHDRHRQLLAQIGETSGDSSERRDLFTQFGLEVKAHALAEDQALWSSLLRKPAVTEDARHAVAEHKEIDDLINDLAARDMASSGWLARFRTMREEYLHHIKEEEQEIFEAVSKHLDQQDRQHMLTVFEQRKGAERRKAEIEPKLMLS